MSRVAAHVAVADVADQKRLMVGVFGQAISLGPVALVEHGIVALTEAVKRIGKAAIDLFSQSEIRFLIEFPRGVFFAANNGRQARERGGA